MSDIISVYVTVTFSYGGWALMFKDKFKLSFTPFYGLNLDCSNDKYENIVEFANNDYCTTMIHYNAPKGIFEVYVRNLWKHPVTDETIDYTIKSFKKTGWKRQDNTNVSELKELMKRDHERTVSRIG